MRSRISRSLWQRFFFAVAATTIRAILPFSLRLCECFSYFQKLAYLLPFSFVLWGLNREYAYFFREVLHSWEFIDFLKL